MNNLYNIVCSDNFYKIEPSLLCIPRYTITKLVLISNSISTRFYDLTYESIHGALKLCKWHYLQNAHYFLFCHFFMNNRNSTFTLCLFFLLWYCITLVVNEMKNYRITYVFWALSSPPIFSLEYVPLGFRIHFFPF